MATHSSIPWTEEPGGLQSIGSQRVGRDWSNLAHAHTSVKGASQAVLLVVKNPSANAGDIRGMGSVPASGRSPGRGHSNPLQYSCLENPHGQRSLVGCSPWGLEELDTTERLRFHYNYIFFVFLYISFDFCFICLCFFVDKVSLWIVPFIIKILLFVSFKINKLKKKWACPQRLMG